MRLTYFKKIELLRFRENERSYKKKFRFKNSLTVLSYFVLSRQTSGSFDMHLNFLVHLLIGFGTYYLRNCPLN